MDALDRTLPEFIVCRLCGAGFYSSLGHICERQWQPTLELRRYDNTGKLTNPRLQQRWTRVNVQTHRQEFEWRDVPLVWEPDRNDVAID